MTTQCQTRISKELALYSQILLDCLNRWRDIDHTILYHMKGLTDLYLNITSK